MADTRELEKLKSAGWSVITGGDDASAWCQIRRDGRIHHAKAQTRDVAILRAYGWSLELQVERLRDERAKLNHAFASADWAQVVLNGGSPCFHIESDGCFCFFAERWVGHKTPHAGFHVFMGSPVDAAREPGQGQQEMTDCPQCAELRQERDEALKEAHILQKMYDKCFKEREEARSRWVLDPIHAERDRLREALEYIESLVSDDCELGVIEILHGIRKKCAALHPTEPAEETKA